MDTPPSPPLPQYIFTMATLTYTLKLQLAILFKAVNQIIALRQNSTQERILVMTVIASEAAITKGSRIIPRAQPSYS